MSDFNPDALSTKEINEVAQIVGAPHYTIAGIRAQSEAAVALAQWVMDVVYSNKVFQDIKFRTSLDTPYEARPVKVVKINHPMPRINLQSKED